MAQKGWKAKHSENASFYYLNYEITDTIQFYLFVCTYIIININNNNIIQLKCCEKYNTKLTLDVHLIIIHMVKKFLEISYQYMNPDWVISNNKPTYLVPINIVIGMYVTNQFTPTKIIIISIIHHLHNISPEDC